MGAVPKRPRVADTLDHDHTDVNPGGHLAVWREHVQRWRLMGGVTGDVGHEVAGSPEPTTAPHAAGVDDTLLTSWQHFTARGAGKFMQLWCYIPIA